ncbi:hypothetical protein MFIFM68171_08640 [Madurella fahalii]|uniref:PLAC8-domain-containing protein n=1 Tax=Madurella fahalii TaxID=1157608 RepID=A0ABQ0GL61_9PEZI
MHPIKENDWQDGLFGCFRGGHCLMGYFCPCILVNKTHMLLTNENDPNPSGCGAWGCGWCVLTLCGIGCILPCLQRGDIRSKYHIDGGCCTDCLANWCCTCCAAIQQFKELEIRRDARMPDKAGYQPQAPMQAPMQ